MVLPYINMNPPQAYTCSPSWTLLPPPSPYHPSGLSQCTTPKHPVSCIEPGLATHFIYDIIHISMPFSQITIFFLILWWHHISIKNATIPSQTKCILLSVIQLRAKGRSHCEKRYIIHHSAVFKNLIKQHFYDKDTSKKKKRMSQHILFCHLYLSGWFFHKA